MMKTRGDLDLTGKLLAEAARKSPLDRDRDLLVAAANEIRRLQRLLEEKVSIILSHELQVRPKGEG
jgi:hypothetical protein